MTVTIEKFDQQKITRIFDGADRIAKAFVRLHPAHVGTEAWTADLESVVLCYLTAEAPWIMAGSRVVVGSRSLLAPGGAFRIECTVDLRPAGKCYRWTISGEPGEVVIKEVA